MLPDNTITHLTGLLLQVTLLFATRLTLKAQVLLTFSKFESKKGQAAYFPEGDRTDKHPTHPFLA